MSSTAALGPWLDAVLARSQVLLLEGPPGIGKSHVWRELVDRIAADGNRILRAQPAQAEARLVGSALIDLCDDVTDDEIAQLPELQAVALSAALLRGGKAASPQAVALAFTTLVRRLVDRQPVFICIDDIQWLDAQTSEVLAFAARRLPPAGAGLLLTVRTDLDTPPPQLANDLASAVHLSRWPVQPMNALDLEQLLRARLGGAVGANVLRSAVGLAGGNPLYGLEVARAILTRGDDNPLDGPRLPESLFELVGRHITRLPDDTRLGLAAAAAIRRPTLRQLRELGLADSLDAAEGAGLIRIDGRDIVFTHPLYAAAAYDGLPTGERMRLHARLAPLVDGDEERARHLALGADDTDEDVAAALDIACDHALRRGALDAAVDAAGLAVRATPDTSLARTERCVRLGNLLFRSGETERARGELSAAAAAAVDDPAARARALHALARVVNDTEGSTSAAPLELEALALAGDDLDLTADIHMGLAVSNTDDWAAALDHARTARELLERIATPDPLRLAAALSAEIGARFYAGGGADFAACERAIELQASDVSLPVSDRALAVLFYLQLWTDDYPAARAQMERAYRIAVDEGDEPSRCYILTCQAQLEVRSGRWDEADRLIDECVALAETSQNPFYAGVMAGQRAWLLAYRGEIDQAVKVADGEIERGISAGVGMVEQRGRGLRGWCSLARGDARNAADELDRYQQLFETNNAGEPALRQLAGDHVEALAAAGRMADAEQALVRIVEPATRLNRTGMLAAAARAEALLRAEQGAVDAAIDAAERSIGLYELIDRRFERARAHLAKGQVHRRYKQKAMARRELTTALEAFEHLGALGLAERARAELGRIGLRPPAAHDLTETERQVAGLAAKGMTSAEIGKTLFLSTKTVSANLTRVYRKLNVRNRAELSALLTARDDV